jgi:hypothetical protein
MNTMPQYMQCEKGMRTLSGFNSPVLSNSGPTVKPGIPFLDVYKQKTAEAQKPKTAVRENWIQTQSRSWRTIAVCRSTLLFANFL